MPRWDDRLDTICIFKFRECEVGRRCSDCAIFEWNKTQTPMESHYRLWYAVIQLDPELAHLAKEKRTHMKGKKKRLKEQSAKIHRKKMTKSEAKRIDWQLGRYDNKKKCPNKFWEGVK